MNTVTISFLFFLACFLGIGVYATTRKRSTPEDYLVASRDIKPWMAALSAVATNNSGFMFIGLIGTTFVQGVSAMWLMVGWVVGDYLMWLARIPDKLRARSEATSSVTIPSFVGHGLSGSRRVTVVAGLITLVFLGLYAAAQLTAGSKALHVLFGWDYEVGAILGAGIVVVYCFAGGIRASIWTDVAQSVVMFLSMTLLCLVAVGAAGGLSGMWGTLAALDPQLTTFTPPDMRGGFLLFMIGWLVAGIGVVGQPHIMVRAMAVDAVENMSTTRRVYVVWNALFAVGAILVGLAARAVLTGEAVPSDAELALPLLAESLLPAPLVGLILAGLFAATMSTADSQVLSCSAALTQDIFPRASESYTLAKLGTLIVMAVVLAMALAGGSVFDLVVLAWSALASGLGPLLILRALGRRVSGPVAIGMMLGALLTVVVWRFELGLTSAIYDVFPGMVAGFLIYAVGRDSSP